MSTSSEDVINKKLLELIQKALKSSNDNEKCFLHNINSFNHLKEQLAKDPFLEIKTQIQTVISKIKLHPLENTPADGNLLDKIDILPYSERSAVG